MNKLNELNELRKKQKELYQNVLSYFQTITAKAINEKINELRAAGFTCLHGSNNE